MSVVSFLVCLLDRGLSHAIIEVYTAANSFSPDRIGVSTVIQKPPADVVPWRG